MIRPFCSRRELLAAAMRELGSLYSGSWDELEEENIRAELRAVGVPVDPVIRGPLEALPDFWESGTRPSHQHIYREHCRGLSRRRRRLP